MESKQSIMERERADESSDRIGNRDRAAPGSRKADQSFPKATSSVVVQKPRYCGRRKYTKAMKMAMGVVVDGCEVERKQQREEVSKANARLVSAEVKRANAAIGDQRADWPSRLRERRVVQRAIPQNTSVSTVGRCLRACVRAVRVSSSSLQDAPPGTDVMPPSLLQLAVPHSQQAVPSLWHRSGDGMREGFCPSARNKVCACDRAFVVPLFRCAVPRLISLITARPPCFDDHLKDQRAGLIHKEQIHCCHVCVLQLPSSIASSKGRIRAFTVYNRSKTY